MRFHAELRWREMDATTFDRTWRVILGALGPRCDQLWLRFGNLGEMNRFLPPIEVAQLEALIGPYWGQPDPIPAKPDPLLTGFLDSLVAGFKEAGFTPVDTSGERYAPYGCAVVPISAELIQTLTSLSVEPSRSGELLDRLADHWALRKDGRSLIDTGVGWEFLSFDLTPAEWELLQTALQEAGLTPAFQERPQAKE